MSTVASRSFRSTPHRGARETWVAIVDLLTRGKDTAAKKELIAVAGVAASCIADQAPLMAPIIVTCDGPRTRIYCLYDDNALDDTDAREDALGFDALNGDWAVSLPCQKEDLAWVAGALAKHSTRITARDMSVGISTETEKSAQAGEMVVDMEGFFGK
jgi:hypothetical protein